MTKDEKRIKQIDAIVYNMQRIIRALKAEKRALEEKVGVEV